VRELEVEGRGEFKEEFVTAGGVELKEVDFRSMESKLRPGLYFAGEILDVDGLTGGFNCSAPGPRASSRAWPWPPRRDVVPSPTVLDPHQVGGGTPSRVGRQRQPLLLQRHEHGNGLGSGLGRPEGDADRRCALGDRHALHGSGAKRASPPRRLGSRESLAHGNRVLGSTRTSATPYTMSET